ncbi:MAG TPA: hypothetical protein VFN42_12170, partial [Acetobacteraceae bacterium]|nr:hypothetical protein [Acetobacteraceae bacterium]
MSKQNTRIAGETAGAAAGGRFGRRAAIGGALGLAASVAAPHIARAAGKYTLRLASWGSPNAPQVAAFVTQFQKLVAGNSHGQIEVQDFPAGSLVSERAVPSAIQTRVVDIALTTMGSWASIAQSAGALNTVFFSPTGDRFEKIIGPGTPLFHTFDADMATHGVRVLAALYNGPVVVVSNASMA